MKDRFRFSFARFDTWGNVMVRCPVCGWTHRLDGIRQHIEKKAHRYRDRAHMEWFRKHGWRRGIKTPARAKMRP